MVSLTRKTQYRAYNAAKQTASKTRQVVMLYDGVIRFVQQARHAIEEKNYEERYKLLVKASEIIIGLQGSLDFDNGGDVARQLYDFYTSIDTQLMAIHRTNSLEGCDEVIDSMKTMRDEWSRIDTLREETGKDETASLAYTDDTAASGGNDADSGNAVSSESQESEAGSSASGDNVSQGVQISV